MDGKYKLIRKIGCGSNGEVYLAINTQNREEVAVKLESINVCLLKKNIKTNIHEFKFKKSNLFYEKRAYKVLQDGDGIPHVRHCGNEGAFCCMVMELLGMCSL